MPTKWLPERIHRTIGYPHKGPSVGSADPPAPPSRTRTCTKTNRIKKEKSSSKTEWNGVHYTAKYLLVTSTHSCSKLHRIKVLGFKHSFYETSRLVPWRGLEGGYCSVLAGEGCQGFLVGLGPADHQESGLMRLR